MSEGFFRSIIFFDKVNIIRRVIHLVTENRPEIFQNEPPESFRLERNPVLVSAVCSGAILCTELSLDLGRVLFHFNN